MWWWVFLCVRCCTPTTMCSEIHWAPQSAPKVKVPEICKYGGRGEKIILKKQLFSVVGAISCQGCSRGCCLHLQTVTRRHNLQTKRSRQAAFSSKYFYFFQKHKWTQLQRAFCELQRAMNCLRLASHIFQCETPGKWAWLLDLFLILHSFEAIFFNIVLSIIYSASGKCFPIFPPFSFSKSSLFCHGRVARELWNCTNLPVSQCWQSSTEK